ncbi:MAG: serine dehydratase subunit alpha family protein [Bacteroidales bacterium]|nr:serine dehydratase subunit alpha family protein [Bacteroidales bacterium]
MTARQAEIIELIRKEVKPALGCTEPIAVALAVAKAMEIIEEKCDYTGSDWRMQEDYTLDIEVSGNILKNGMGVGIPGTGMVGLHIASALGAVCGKSRYGLEVLSDLDPVSIGQAKKMVEEDAVKIGLAETDLKLYVKASVLSDGHKASAVIAGDHDNIVETSFDGQLLSSSQKKADGEVKESKSTLDYKLTVKEIYEFASTVAYEDIEFILESRTLNLALAQEGLKGTYGLKVGYAIALNENREVFGGDFLCYAMSLTAAASDARMAGCTLAAMSNSGSGNQGITVTMPVIAYSLRYGTSDEELARALVLSHLIAIHIKGYLGKLSALCGCVIASTGSACGLVYLRGGDYEQICAAIKNMIGNITGMVCDGAKVGCAMKVASGVSSALQSAVLAREGICISEHDGIIEKDIEKTVQNLGRIGSVGMQNTDNMILDIMVCK